MNRISIVLIFILLNISCSPTSIKEKSMAFLGKMKAEDYFNNDVQVKFAKSIEKGNIAQMADLLTKGADVNAIGKDGITSLFWAISKDRIDSFKFLLENGANPNYRIDAKSEDSKGIVLLEIAAIHENPEYLKLSLEHNGNPNTLNSHRKESILFNAIINERINNIKILIENGANINFIGVEGRTPIIYAADANLYNIVFLLIENGANLSMKDSLGYSIAELVDENKDAGLHINSEQYNWYLKVVNKLKERGLLDKNKTYLIKRNK